MRCSGSTFAIRAFFTVIVLGLIIGGIFSGRGVLDWSRMARQNGQLRTKIEAAQLEKEGLESRIRRLRTSQFEQRQVVRQTLGYINKNEIVIEF
jgi:hypothetical protein